MKKALKFAGYFLIALILYVGLTLIHGTVTDYQPEEVISLEPVIKGNPESIISDTTLTFMIWNLGYAGLGAESNFFFDKGGMFLSKGRMVRPTEELVQKNIDGILSTINSIQSDFYLLQEVDFESKRSYRNNQYELVLNQLENYEASFSANYLAPRVPIPIFEPWNAYGKVHSGLATYSPYTSLDNTRYQLPGSFSWPTRIFQLDRCAAVHRYQVDNGKELIVINVHNSAYDSGGELKKQQMEFLKNFLITEYEKGNYVVVGGDWNQCPPFFPFDKFSPGQSQGYSQINIEPDFLPDNWTWVYDPLMPTNRKVGDIYIPGETFETLIDFFLISPNIQAVQVKGIQTSFAYSDHQPVLVKLELKK